MTISLDLELEVVAPQTVETAAELINAVLGALAVLGRVRQMGGVSVGRGGQKTVTPRMDLTA